MKKLLLTLLATIAFIAHADTREPVTIIYGFSAGDNSANYARHMIEEANRIQDKYNFMFDAKPGAGQTVAVNYVKSTPNQIFMTSGAFWVRPNFYPDASYDVKEFRTIMSMCSVPFAVGSGKYKTWKDVPTDKAITVSTSGLGIVSHLVAIEIQKKYPKAIIVPFKSTTDAVLATSSGQVDFVVGFVGDIEKFTGGTDSNHNMTILGATGTAPSGQYPTLVSQGFNRNLAKMSTPYNLMVPTSWSAEKAKEVRSYLVKAETNQAVRDSYALDFCAPFQVPEKQLSTWFDEQNKYWSSLTVGVKVD